MKGNGHIIEGTSIRVDYWKWTPDEEFLHFLTHLHADHTVGLTSSFRKRIYTSPFNAWLARRWFNIDPELLVPLSVGDAHVIFDEHSGNYFCVTLIDANHCPGSVMFLFQGHFGNIFYTGDFRYNPEMLEFPAIKSVIDNNVLHRVYLDNTFAAEHCEFPSRKEALQQAIGLIREHPEHHVILGVRKLGKEEAIRDIGLALEEKVFVSEERLKILRYLKYPNIFTTNEAESRIFVKEINQITTTFIRRMQEEKGPVLTILLTALYSVTAPGTENSSSPLSATGVHHIPYSDHSCHSELVAFISKLRPHTIYPVVTTTLKNKNIYLYEDNSIIPQSILSFVRNSNIEGSTANKAQSLSKNKVFYEQEIIEGETADEFCDVVCDSVKYNVQRIINNMNIPESESTKSPRLKKCSISPNNSDSVKSNLLRIISNMNVSDSESTKSPNLEKSSLSINKNTNIANEEQTKIHSRISPENLHSEVSLSVSPQNFTVQLLSDEEYYTMSDEDLTQQKSSPINEYYSLSGALSEKQTVLNGSPHLIKMGLPEKEIVQNISLAPKQNSNEHNYLQNKLLESSRFNINIGKKDQDNLHVTGLIPKKTSKVLLTNMDSSNIMSTIQSQCLKNTVSNQITENKIHFSVDKSRLENSLEALNFLCEDIQNNTNPSKGCNVSSNSLKPTSGSNLEDNNSLPSSTRNVCPNIDFTSSLNHSCDIHCDTSLESTDLLSGLLNYQSVTTDSTNCSKSERKNKQNSCKISEKFNHLLAPEFQKSNTQNKSALSNKNYQLFYHKDQENGESLIPKTSLVGDNLHLIKPLTIANKQITCTKKKKFPPTDKVLLDPDFFSAENFKRAYLSWQNSVKEVEARETVVFTHKNPLNPSEGSVNKIVEPNERKKRKRWD